jgi:hypothetical protein
MITTGTAVRSSGDAQALAQSMGILRGEIKKDPEALKRAAEQLVSAALVQPALASMREMSTAAGAFAPTDAEKRFGPMLDAMLADRVVHASNFELPKLIVERIQGRGGKGVTA